MKSGLQRALLGFLALDALGLALLAQVSDLNPGISYCLCSVAGFVGFGVTLKTVLCRLHRRDRVRFAALVCGAVFVVLLLAAFTYIAVSQPDYLAGAPEPAYGFNDTSKVHLLVVVCACLVFSLLARKAKWVLRITTHKGIVVACLLLVAVWVAAFARILSTDEFPPSGGVLPEGCARQPEGRGDLSVDYSSYDRTGRLLGTDSHSNPTELVSDEERRRVSLSLFRGAEVIATRQMSGPYVGVIHALDGGYVVWRNVGHWPDTHVVMEQMDENLQPVQTASFSSRYSTSLRVASPNSYCLVSGNHRYTFLDANLRRSPNTAHVSEWLTGTSMLSAWASLVVLLFWGLALAFTRLRWNWFCGLRFDAIWRGGQREPTVEVNGEIYRVRMPQKASIELRDGDHCVLFATQGLDEESGPYRARRTLRVKRWFRGTWSEVEECRRVNTRGLNILAVGVLWMLAATAVELIFV